MKPVDVVDEGFCHLRSGVRVSKRYEMGVLGQFVDDDQDAIVLPRWREPVDEVHRGHLPCFSWYGERLQQAWGENPFWFSSLACVARVNVVLDSSLHACPLKQREQVATGDREAGVATLGTVVKGKITWSCKFLELPIHM